MSTLADPDLHRAASHRNMADHLTAPLAAGAIETVLPVGASARIDVGWQARQPLVLAAPAATLGPERLRLEATLPGGSSVTLEFAPFSERGAFLPLYLPPVDATTGFADPFALAFDRLSELAPDGTRTAVPKAQIGARIEVCLVEGILGRVSYLLGAEKQRIRRQAREIAAMRRLATARADALDRIGGELSVPRLADQLAFRAGQIVTKTAREPDASFRRRLRAYRPWLLPTRDVLLELLNGPGQAADPNAGPLGELGLADRFALVEEDNPFAVALTLVAGDDAYHRDSLLELVRQAYLVWPRADAASEAVYGARFRSAERAVADERLRQSLRDSFSFVSAGPTAAVAPALAAALARAGACRRALGATTKWRVLRAQRDDGGSRYELGLGADLEPLAPAELDALAQAHAARQPNPDPELEGLLAAMVPRPASSDPEGRWLLEPCGLRTVHRVDTTTLYVSHLPVFGLTVTAPPVIASGGWSAVAGGPFISGDFGYYGTNVWTGIVLYDRSAGELETLSIDPLFRGNLSKLGSKDGLRTTWTAMIPGSFGGAPETADLLFYERPSGTGELYSTDDDGVPELLQRHTGWRTTWSAIASARLSAGPTSDLVFYDRSAGQLELYATDGQGNLRFLRRHDAWRRSWSHVVPARYLDSAWDAILFFDRSLGDAELYASDGAGGLELVARYEDWRPWTHVVAGVFGGGGSADRLGGRFADLFLYDARSGSALVLAGDGAGGFSPLADPPRLRPGWTHVAPIGWLPGAATTAALGMLLYDRTTGTAELRATELPQLELVRSYEGWRKHGGLPVSARYHAPGDPGANAALVAGLAAAAAAWTAAPHNGLPWTSLSDVQAHARWQAATAVPSSHPALGVFRAAGLPALADPGPVVEQLLRVAGELLETVVLAPAHSAEIVSGAAGAADRLRELVGVLRDAGLASVLPLLTGPGEVSLVVSVIGLPQAGVNLSDRRASGFRWYTVPIQGLGGAVSGSGPRATYTPTGPGVSALVVLGYVRGSATDPYEFRVELPEGATLDLAQYEYLMNVLDHAYPVGVEVNTFALRRKHVDLDGDGLPEPLDPPAARTYRPYRRRRARGQPGVTLDDQ